MQKKHWSKFELLHEVVTNPNIHVKGQHSYYSDCWDNGFEQSVVRYLHGDDVSRQWELDGKSTNSISAIMSVLAQRL